jgi:NADH dehydrogenase
MTINIPDTDQQRVVIIGAGFAGLQLAQILSRTHYQVVLIDKNNYYQFQPLFYQVAMSGLEPSSIVFPIRKMFQKDKNIIIRVTEVQGVDCAAQTITTSVGNLQYDYLVLATGADTNFFGNERIASLAIPMKSVSEALYLRNAILQDYEKSIMASDYDTRQQLIDIVVVGGGPTGVEVSGALAEMRKYVIPKDYPELDPAEIDIYLIEGSDRLLSGMSKEASAKAQQFLENLGVKIMLNTFVTDFDGETVYMNKDKKIPTRKVIWAAGIKGNKLKGIPESAIAQGNRIKVNTYCQVEGFENIFAIGDIAFMQEGEYEQGHPQVAQAALQQGKLVGKNLRRSEKGKAWKAFSYKDKGSMATIGRHLAVADLPGFKSQGAFAWIIWLFVHLFALLGIKNKLFVFINWVWNYFTYDQSLRLIIRPKHPNKEGLKEEIS